MFKLQRLEITGFKSFADHTEIVFTGNGITAVVGPNGCGKSNVSDCISWVLGEQRAKSLRGGEMKDVIFQGSRNRKPGGLAEVVLHLVRDEDLILEDDEELFEIDEAISEIDERAVDVSALEAASKETTDPVSVGLENGNANGFQHPAESETEMELVRAAQVGSAQIIESRVKVKRHWRPRSIALDFAPGEAVSVTRRLYLSGESEYLLNGRSCRLRDIQDLFAGTGLSGAHYAIVEQGRIGQILSAKPSDRRTLIEEAAGISKFRSRQRAAEARLESAKANLSRISDIVSEIDKQANSLRRQAAKTRRFIALQEDYRIRLRELFAAEGRHYTNTIEHLAVELKQAAHDEQSLASMVADQESFFRDATAAARAAEEELTALRHRQAENALARDRAEREHRYQTEQLEALSNRLESLRSEKTAIGERMKLADSEIFRLREEEEKECEESDASRSLLAEAELHWSEKLTAAKEVEDRLESVRAILIQHTVAIERFDELLRQLNLNAERLNDRLKSLEAEKDRAEFSIKDHRQDALRFESELKSEYEKLKRFSDEKAEVISAVAAAREKLQESEEILRRSREDLSAKKNRRETLQELEETKAVYYPQVQRLFADQKKIGISPAGVLADHLVVDETAERAVEAIFGPFLQAVVVTSEEDSRKASVWANGQGIGRISILILEAKVLSGPKAESAPGTIASLLGASKGLVERLSEIFPRELNARFVDSIEGLTSRKEGIVVSKAGDIAISGGLFVTGTTKKEEKNSSLLAFKRELAGLASEVEKLSVRVAVAEEDVKKNRLALVEQEEKIVDLQSLIIKVERGLVALEIQQKANVQEIERAERHRGIVVSEIEHVMAESVNITDKLAEAAAAEEQAVGRRIAVESEFDRINKELEVARTRADADSVIVNERRTKAATSEERRRSVAFALRRLSDERADLEERLSINCRGTDETEETIARLHDSIEEIAGKIASATNKFSGEEEALASAMSAVTAARLAADAASDKLAELNRRAAEAINFRSSVDVRKTEAVTELRNISERCQQELHRPLNEIVDEVEIPVDFDLQLARTTAEEQRARLEGFGAINMLAVAELAEAEERLDFLTSQRQDIIDSIVSAEEALREIKVRSRARFRDAFEAINANFSEFFSELFGGGKGVMSLLEADDILEAGIEIVAQPPGKRLQNILLLSGGEKAMTAIALVLAIFKYRPSPFCLLDEVDAPLDDANVGRFVSKIAEMAEKTQFIVITHNKRTMEAARALYGVTMEEAGISKIVSVKFD